MVENIGLRFFQLVASGRKLHSEWFKHRRNLMTHVNKKSGVTRGRCSLMQGLQSFPPPYFLFFAFPTTSHVPTSVHFCLCCHNYQRDSSPQS